MTGAQVFGVLFTCAVILIVAALKQAADNQQAADQSNGGYDTADLRTVIQSLSMLSEQLDNCDRMLADLEACNPETLARGFHAAWCGIDGRQRTIDFIADGENAATVGLRTAAQAERDRLNNEILETIRALNVAIECGTIPEIDMDGMDGTVDGTTEGCIV